MTEAVAFSLYKLMAYKDEYEVARLILDDSFDATVRDEFGPDARYQVRLHPPLLRSMGLNRKIALGPAWRPVFRLLSALRRVRGSRLDLFGHHPVRRVERELIDEYRREIDAVLPCLATDTAEAVTEIAALPDMIRGYEDIKLAAVHRYREKLARLRAELTACHAGR